MEFLHAIPALGESASFLYIILSAQLSLLAVVCACYKTTMLRGLMISFFLCFFVSLPLWWLTPAISPSQYLREQALGKVHASHEEYAATIRQAAQGGGEMYQHILLATEVMWKNSSSIEWYATSAQPSMHVAWGLVLAWYAFLVRRWLGVVCLISLFGNIVGTVYLLQHYSIDVVTGACVGALVLVLTRVLLRFEKKYMAVDEAYWFPALVVLQRETRLLLMRIRFIFAPYANRRSFVAQVAGWFS